MFHLVAVPSTLRKRSQPRGMFGPQLNSCTLVDFLTLTLTFVSFILIISLSWSWNQGIEITSTTLPTTSGSEEQPLLPQLEDSVGLKLMMKKKSGGRSLLY